MVDFVGETAVVALRCEYCGYKGGYPDEIEFRELRDGNSVQACIDRDACDKRWAETHSEESS